LKDQYFGDVNDYRKYGLLRCIAEVGLKIGVCWLLTPDDRKGHGELRRYLAEPERWRDYDNQLYDALQRLGDPKVPRTVKYAHEWSLVPGARYFTERLADQAEARDIYFHAAFTALAGSDLIFFDPDNGLEVSSTPRGSKGSAAYVYRREIGEAFKKGYSILLYQHYPRVNRARFAHFLADRLAEELGAAEVSAFVTSHVVFFLVQQPGHRRALAAASESVRSKWHGQIEVWAGPIHAAPDESA